MLGTAVARFLERRNRVSAGQVGLVLMYHQIGPGLGDPAHELVPQLDLELFRAQLEHLSACYRIVQLGELQANIAARRAGDPIPVALTFDDDLPSHAQYVVPLLAEAGAPATFFLTGSTLFGEPSFWWHDLQSVADEGGLEWTELRRELGGGGRESSVHQVAQTIESMSPTEQDQAAERIRVAAGPAAADRRLAPAEIKGIAGAGFEIGFHTLRHRNLQTVPAKYLQQELTEGLDEIEGLIGQRPTSIAYPHCRADGRITTAARASGFELGCICDGGTVGAMDDPLMTDRMDGWSGSISQFRLKLALAVRSST